MPCKSHIQTEKREGPSLLCRLEDTHGRKSLKMVPKICVAWWTHTFLGYSDTRQLCEGMLQMSVRVLADFKER